MARLIDTARLRAKAGDGGRGSSSLKKSKRKPGGSPDGGDGGNGGSIILAADSRRATLAEYEKGKLIRAEGGGLGSSNTRHGKNGADSTLMVPVGTVVSDSRGILADLAKPAMSYVLAKGGRGGRGNAALVSRAERFVDFSEPGEQGDYLEVFLELRITADVGLIGQPNAGKSTLLAAMTKARPKTAPYPFTTLEPHLGVVGDRDYEGYIIADLPGLIEGAATGKGLGIKFLRHASRCRVLALVCDASVESVAQDAAVVLDEVRSYDENMVDKVSLVIANKIDLPNSKEGVTALKQFAQEHGFEFAEISAVEGLNIPALDEQFTRLIAATGGEHQTFAVFRPVETDPIVVAKEGDSYRISSRRVERAVISWDLNNPRALSFLHRKLRAMGVYKVLERAGAVNGDEIRVGSLVFEYRPAGEGSEERPTGLDLSQR